MNVVQDIFEAFGSAVALAEATGFPQQTVNEWRTRVPAEIPPWRRPSVADAARREGKALSQEALAYLASSKRTPTARPATEERAA